MYRHMYRYTYRGIDIHRYIEREICNFRDRDQVLKISYVGPIKMDNVLLNTLKF